MNEIEWLISPNIYQPNVPIFKNHMINQSYWLVSLCPKRNITMVDKSYGTMICRWYVELVVYS